MISPSRSSSIGPNASSSPARWRKRKRASPNWRTAPISPSELATLTRLRVDLFMTLGRSDRAVAVGLECLRRFGIAWSAHPTKDEVRDEYRPALAAARRSLDRSADRPAPDGGSGRARDD